MKRTRIAGLCLVAVCAMFALTASSALAFTNKPHYGKCVAKAGGKYSSAACTKIKAGTNTDEWEPLTTTVAFKSAKEKATGNAVLETASKTKIQCEGQAETGAKFGPGDQVKEVVGEFSKCSGLGFPCESEGKPEGLINTFKLHGELGIVTVEAKHEKDILGNDLKGETGEDLASFTCGGAPVIVKGGVVVKAQADSTGGTTGEINNKMENKLEVEFVDEEGGKQVPEVWTPNGEGITHSSSTSTTEVLESSLAGGGFEHSGQSLTTVEETTEAGKPKVEVRMCEDIGKTAIECAN